jgi:hypothetical protein
MSPPDTPGEVSPMMPHGEASPMMAHHEMSAAGHVYVQTNETHNCVIHYHRAADGTLTEHERVPTGDAGSGGYNPIVKKDTAPNPLKEVW